MPNFYFTFGQSHCQNDGTPMKDYFVKVVANDYGAAREKFVGEFSSEFMPSPDKWSFQYDELNFKPEYYPNGEYTTLC